MPRLTSSLVFFSLAFTFSWLCGEEKSSGVEVGTTLILSGKELLLQQTLCGEEAFGTGYFSFFHADGKTLCARGSRSYPKSTIIMIPRTAAPVILPFPWRLVDGYDTLLLYDETAPMVEGSDETGTPLSLTPLGYYVDDAGNIRTPRFVRRKDGWEPLVPLREIFLLSIERDRRFTVVLGSCNDLSDIAKDPFRTLGIAAESAAIRTHDPHFLVVEGSGLTKAHIPRFRFIPTDDAFGRYRIEIQDPLRSSVKKLASLETGTLVARYEQNSEGLIRFECQILQRLLPENDWVKLDSFMKKNLPSRYEAKKR